MILSIASGLHGHDTAPKGVLVAASGILYAAIGYLLLGYLGIIAGVLAAGWWFVFRTGEQARTELRCMDWHREEPATYKDVLKAHYYTGWLTILGLYLFNYGTKWGIKLGWENQWHKQGHIRGKTIIWNHGQMMNKPFWDCRRPTELLTGLTGDLMIAAILWVL